MLRITLYQDGSQCCLKLAGRLCGPWVSETENAWRSARPSGKDIQIDIREVTGIDNDGRDLLARMHHTGARPMAKGLWMNTLVNEITGATVRRYEAAAGQVPAGAIMNAKPDIERANEVSSAPPFVELDQSVPSRASAIWPFVNGLMRFIELFMGKVAASREEGDEIEIALGEAVANAVIHGNREDPEKRVFVSCRCSMNGEVLITVRDQGQGFNSQLFADPVEPERLFLTQGRGLQLMRALMDEVSFEENGTVVRMRKRMKITIL